MAVLKATQCSLKIMVQIIGVYISPISRELRRSLDDHHGYDTKLINKEYSVACRTPPNPLMS
jgi:IS30 family transposase